MREIRLIVIHSSNTPDDDSLFDLHDERGTPTQTPAIYLNVRDKIHGRHRESYWRGRQNAALDALGAHYIVGRNGSIFSGRHHDESPDMTTGFDGASIAVMLVGTSHYEPEQMAALGMLITSLAKTYTLPLNAPKLTRTGYVAQRGIAGHGDIINPTDPCHATCPGFDVQSWLETLETDSAK